MSDEREGFVVIFPENFPDWALTPDERRAKLQLVEGKLHGDEDGDAARPDREQ